MTKKIAVEKNIFATERNRSSFILIKKIKCEMIKKLIG